MRFLFWFVFFCTWKSKKTQHNNELLFVFHSWPTLYIYIHSTHILHTLACMRRVASSCGYVAGAGWCRQLCKAEEKWLSNSSAAFLSQAAHDSKLGRFMRLSHIFDRLARSEDLPCGGGEFKGKSKEKTARKRFPNLRRHGSCWDSFMANHRTPMYPLGFGSGCQYP